MKPKEYLNETEHVVKQLFESLAYYRQILEEMPKPVFISDTEFEDEEVWNAAFAEWYKENKEEIDKSKEMSREYFGLSFSNATLCGSILQVSSMGISKFSNNECIPESCREFIKSKQEAKHYCIGRDVRSLPIGIIIYAGRHQYNHWDDPEPRKITKNIFEIISKSHGYSEAVDPAFDLSNPILNIYSHNILGLLEWHTYEQYITDMHQLIVN